jgi:hypothetical protein
MVCSLKENHRDRLTKRSRTFFVIRQRVNTEYGLRITTSFLSSRRGSCVVCRIWR